MVVAMANHLNYDIYNVEFTIVNNNDDLRKLLIQTTSMSIIVIEDIDCSLDLTANQRFKKKNRPYHKDRKVTLSGLFNFIDGLWSACGGERIGLDPALIWRG
jgi:chaperone BCS1